MNRAPLGRTQTEAYGIQRPAPTTNSAATPAPLVTEPAGQSSGSVSRQPDTPTQRANVSYSGGQLTVVASNSSLNQILREISRLAAINIVGGVADEHVFGNYGPASPAEVLNTLLDGTGSNMMFVAANSGNKAQLTLTPRTGGPTPPSPNSSTFAQADEPPPPPAAPAPQASEPPQPSGQPDANAPAPPPGDSSTPASTAASSSDSSDSSQSNGAKTPQQIFEQLMKLRQQQ